MAQKVHVLFGKDLLRCSPVCSRSGRWAWSRSAAAYGCAELLANEKAALLAEFEKSRVLLAGGTARQRRAWDF